ncbi:MAG TPA: FHA domain-containing protein [Thermoanaerobaculia bacterium]
MADKRCENGHFIDESWDICPYCPQDNSEPEIPIVRPTRNAGDSAGSPGSAPARPALVQQAPATPIVVPPPVSISSASARRDTAAGALLAAASPAAMDRTVATAGLKSADAQQKRYVVGWLVGLNGSARGESFPIRMGRNVIGRDRRSDIVIADDQASSHHADLVFRPEERRFILMDHNSTNGTYVNEMEIEPRRDLTPNDVIRIGSHRFLFAPLCHDGFFWDDEGLLR